MHRGQRSSPREATSDDDQQAGGRDLGEPYALGVDIGDETVTAAVCHPDGTPAPVLVDAAVLAAATVGPAPAGSPGLIDPADARPQTPAPVTRHLMSRVGVPVPLVVAGHPVQAADIVAAVVAAVQSRAAAQEGHPPSWTVLTVPPSWGPHRQAALTEALAEHATGPVSLASGAVAAARHQLAEEGAAGRTVAVYDLGASTLDTAVVRTATDGGPAHVAVPPAPLPWGGRDVDDAVLGHVVAALSGGPRTTPAVRTALAGIRAQCVAAKEALSTGTHARLDVDLPTGTTTLRVVREDLEELLADDVRSTVDTLRRTVEGAGLRVTDLDGVLLVGGAGRMPLVAELLSAELGRPLLVPEDPALAGALGAARLGLDHLVAGTGAADGTDPADGDHGAPAAVAPGDDTGRPAAPAAQRRPTVRRPPAARPSRTRSPVAPAGRRGGRRVVVVGGVLVTLLAVPAAFGLPQSRETAGTATSDALPAAEDRDAGWPSSWWPAAAAEAAGDRTGDVAPGTAAAEGADRVTGTSVAAARQVAAPAAADPADEPRRATSGGRPAGGSTGTEDPDVVTAAGSPVPAETTTDPSPSTDMAPGTPTSPAPTTGTTSPAGTPTTSTPPASTPPTSTPPASAPPASAPPTSTSPPASAPPSTTPPAGTPPPSTPTTSTPPPAPPTTSASEPGADTGSAPEASTTPETEAAPPAEPTGSDPGAAV